ncbi:hypothetical protein EB796_003442 [Bugula neritina]|uniref:Fucolectin tachylectin-4 pentraxin-1 domain-containing protein n=1 Tax=Bugula neritina TaxID=10212 RepID=A0A7J7KJ21_BUGNE|nr:hypothetical protein EB796_003442 [Bugula neritina]
MSPSNGYPPTPTLVMACLLPVEKIGLAFLPMALTFRMRPSTTSWERNNTANFINECIDIDSANRNLALMRPTTQSSTFTGNANVAVDGVTNFTSGGDVYTSTLSAPNQWWRVDLGLIVGLTDIILVFPNNEGETTSLNTIS